MLKKNVSTLNVDGVLQLNRKITESKRLSSWKCLCFCLVQDILAADCRTLLMMSYISIYWWTFLSAICTCLQVSAREDVFVRWGCNGPMVLHASACLCIVRTIHVYCRLRTEPHLWAVIVLGVVTINIRRERKKNKTTTAASTMQILFAVVCCLQAATMTWQLSSAAATAHSPHPASRQQPPTPSLQSWTSGQLASECTTWLRRRRDSRHSSRECRWQVANGRGKLTRQPVCGLWPTRIR